MRMTDEELEKAINEAPVLILAMERDVGTFDTDMENAFASYNVGFCKKILEMAIEIKELRDKSVVITEALTYYADVSKYVSPYTGGLGDLYFDCGTVAREALNAQETS